MKPEKLVETFKAKVKWKWEKGISHWVDLEQNDLEGAPEVSARTFTVANNENLSSLKGCPTKINGSLRLINLKALRKLDHLPIEMRGLELIDLKLDNLSGAFKNIESIDQLSISNCTFDGSIGDVLSLDLIHFSCLKISPIEAQMAFNIIGQYFDIDPDNRTFEDRLMVEEQLIDAGLEKYL